LPQTSAQKTDGRRRSKFALGRSFGGLDVLINNAGALSGRVRVGGYDRSRDPDHDRVWTWWHTDPIDGRAALPKIAGPAPNGSRCQHHLWYLRSLPRHSTQTYGRGQGVGLAKFGRNRSAANSKAEGVHVMDSLSPGATDTPMMSSSKGRPLSWLPRGRAGCRGCRCGFIAGIADDAFEGRFRGGRKARPPKMNRN